MNREEAIECLSERVSIGGTGEQNCMVVFGVNTDTLDEAFDMAISALRQQEHPQWISVKDRLPDYMGEVLVIVSGKPHENITLDGAYEIAEYDPVEGWILEMWPEWCSGFVTHWMPMPEPPEDDHDERKENEHV